jgi:peptidoglycan-associated lipoprotein
MAALALSAACKKKTAAVAPPPVAEPPKAVVSVEPPKLQNPPRIDSFTVEPSRIERGQTVTLRWATSNAETVTIDQGIGEVPASGTRQLSPTATTTYVMIARSPVGSDTRTVTVEVVAPPPPPVATPPANPNAELTRLISQLQDVLFDFDMSELRDDARRAVNANADTLKRIFALNPNLTFVVEGHCDERGSAEYNLGLGDRRATVTRDALIQLGVPASKLRTVSFGEEAPVCTESNEDCWQRNRRAHLSVAQ